MFLAAPVDTLRRSKHTKPSQTDDRFDQRTGNQFGRSRSDRLCVSQDLDGSGSHLAVGERDRSESGLHVVGDFRPVVKADYC